MDEKRNDIYVKLARVRGALSQFFHEDINEAIKIIKSDGSTKGNTLLASCEGKTVDEKIAILKGMKIRISPDATVRVASTICTVLHEFIYHGVMNLIKSNQSILKIRHLLDNHHQLKYNVLINKIKLFTDVVVSRNYHFLKGLKQSSMFNITETVPTPKMILEKQQKPFTFKCDVTNIFNKIKTIVSAPTLQLSTECKQFCSSLVSLYIARLAMIIKYNIKSNGVKTIKEPLIVNIINQHFLIENIDPNEMTTINEKVAAFNKKNKKKICNRKPTNDNDVATVPETTETTEKPGDKLEESAVQETVPV